MEKIVKLGSFLFSFLYTFSEIEVPVTNNKKRGLRKVIRPIIKGTVSCEGNHSIVKDEVSLHFKDNFDHSVGRHFLFTKLMSSEEIKNLPKEKKVAIWNDYKAKLDSPISSIITDKISTKKEVEEAEMINA